VKRGHWYDFLLDDEEFMSQEEIEEYLNSAGIDLQQSYEDFCRLVEKKRGELFIKRQSELSAGYRSTPEGFDGSRTVYESPSPEYRMACRNSGGLSEEEKKVFATRLGAMHQMGK
jgi:hypothetical protein